MERANSLFSQLFVYSGLKWYVIYFNADISLSSSAIIHTIHYFSIIDPIPQPIARYLVLPTRHLTVQNVRAHTHTHTEWGRILPDYWEIFNATFHFNYIFSIKNESIERFLLKYILNWHLKWLFLPYIFIWNGLTMLIHLWLT